MALMIDAKESNSCGVGAFVSLKQQASHQNLQMLLSALKNLEHRGGKVQEDYSGDGAGILVDIPFDFFGHGRDEVAVATLYLPQNEKNLRFGLRIMEQVFAQFGLEVIRYRNVPIRPEAIAPSAAKIAPVIKHAFIKRPKHCRTKSSFDKLLHNAKQITKACLKNEHQIADFFFASLSSRTIVYKALTNSFQLEQFYPDLQNPNFKIKFGILHRRFSTNTSSTWDRVQPFRLLAHNGEINTISGNRTWAISRERSLGLRKEELLNHWETSDSSSLNDMVEALRYNSSNDKLHEIVSLLIPPALPNNKFYNFWARALEPWDGPALVAYTDGKTLAARLDRNGFRPCRWAQTKDYFFLASEAGAFEVAPQEVLAQGCLGAGQGVKIHISSGAIDFKDPSLDLENKNYPFDTRTLMLQECPIPSPETLALPDPRLFHYSKEDLEQIIFPMVDKGIEAIGSMGDTSTVAILSSSKQSFFDYFYQSFAQVTNPPLDYLREKLVTDLRNYLGRKPNIFEPKEMLPPSENIGLSTPVLGLGQLEMLKYPKKFLGVNLKTITLSTCFWREDGVVGLKYRLNKLAEDAVDAIRHGFQIIILSDRQANFQNLPIPSLLALRAVQLTLNRKGIRMRGSIIVDSAEVKNSNHLAMLISFGATAVCPYQALQFAAFEQSGSYEKIRHIDPDQREKNFITTLESGLLKIMSKMGISVLRSYQGSQLFTPLGLDSSLLSKYFPEKSSLIEGMNLVMIAEKIITNAQQMEQNPDQPRFAPTFRFKEHPTEKMGEKHSFSTRRAKLIHQILAAQEVEKALELLAQFQQMREDQGPNNVRDLFCWQTTHLANPETPTEVMPIAEILQTFGSGAMSFGAINAEAQRDIFLAMKQIQARSNSGEGGENPYLSSSIKQIASGRFGVTAKYLKNAQEIQLKMAQGAKPGEGGQLMKSKVSVEIAQARHTIPGINLISPPPMHDIYSIEDLAQLIYEVKQLNPTAAVSVKLVSGNNIGNIAVGVVKAGADIVHVAGSDGGTGAAGLLSMHHCGMPWEFGLWEVHQLLLSNGLRHLVRLRVDGNLQTGKDLVLAAIFGADQFDFGKMLLVAEGCVMARVCEKNTCPVGIATHDPKLKGKYQGNPEKIVRYLELVALDVQKILQQLQMPNLAMLKGKTHLLQANPRWKDLIYEKNIDLKFFLQNSELAHTLPDDLRNRIPVGTMNQTILTDLLNYGDGVSGTPNFHYHLRPQDRAVGATAFGHFHTTRPFAQAQLNFTGSAGGGFGAFITEGFKLLLQGQANDFVGKSMSGGQIVIHPPKDVRFAPSKSVVIGNCAFYGATAGIAYIKGLAGDRFAIRNSGAIMVVEGVGQHACEYMTGGEVYILGKAGKNLGAGMSNGTIYSLTDLAVSVNEEYVQAMVVTDQDRAKVLYRLLDYAHATNAENLISYLADENFPLFKFTAIREEVERPNPIGANSNQGLSTATLSLAQAQENLPDSLTAHLL